MLAAASLSAVAATAGLAGAQGLLPAGAPSGPPDGSSAATGPRTATLDWAHLETLLALGANVVAGPELRQFREVAVEPQAPETIADIGLRGLPNLETMSFAKPDLIFNSNYYAWADPLLSGIAPTHNFAIYMPGEDPYVMAERATVSIGDRLGARHASAYVGEVNGRLDALRQELAGRDQRPVLLANLGDARHYRVFGADSMFGSVLTRLGIENAWTSATAYSATAPIGIETIASMPDAIIVLIPPYPLDAMMALERGAFWNALPAVRTGRVVNIGSVNPYGSLPAARRFAEELAKGLTSVRNG